MYVCVRVYVRNVLGVSFFVCTRVYVQCVCAHAVPFFFSFSGLATVRKDKHRCKLLENFSEKMWHLVTNF